MKISKLVVQGYGPFRERYELDLSREDFYAVTARWEHDETRSNFGGKSWFVRAIALALFDEHSAETADGWINAHCPEGRVELVLDDGTEISRARKRGASTQLRVKIEGVEASGDHAQKLLVERLGIDGKDLFVTSFVEQKKTDRLVTSRPSALLEIVSEWFGLDRVRECRKRAGQDFAKARAALKACSVPTPTQLLDRLERDLTGLRLADDTPDEEIVAAAHGAREEFVANLTAATKRVEELRTKAEKESERLEKEAQLRADSREFLRLAEHGKSLQAKLKAFKLPPEVAKETIEEAKHQAAEARAAVRDRADKVAAAERLARGEFDGKCPVNGRSCPVAGEISSDTAANRAACKAAGEALRTAKEADRATEKALDDLDREVRERDRAVQEKARLEADLKDTADRARRLKDAHQKASKLGTGEGEGESPRALYEAAVEAREGAKGDVDRAKAWLADWDAFRRDRDAKRKEVEALDLAFRVAGDKVEVFQRSEREIGAAVLGEVEEMANRLLATANVDLSIRVEWFRETGQLEPRCGRCGWEYPRGRATKECGDCGARRGPKLEEGLWVKPSVRSDGAAADLCSLAFQFAATAWLREERGTRWDVLVLDEVTAACDTAHRKALGQVIARMAREVGFRQLFMVTHAQDAVEALPARIEILATKTGSSVQVLA